jgi:hypothetical protein
MAIIFMDGFDMYTQSTVARKGYGGTPGSPNNVDTGRFSGQSWKADSNANPMTTPTFTAIDSIAIGFAYQQQNVNSNYSTGKAMMTFRNGSTEICKLGVDQNGALKFGRGDFTTNNVCSSSNGAIVAGAWNYIEVELVRATGSGGSVNVYLNGALVANASSTNTGASSIDNIAITTEAASSGNRWIDDFYIVNTNTKLGECKIETLRPTADTAQKDWTPNSGANNYSRVNNTTFDDDTSYNADATVGHKDLFDLADLSSTPSSIKAVQTVFVARKDDATTRTARVNMKNGSTTTNGTTRSMASTYGLWNDIYETNPDTSAAFTASNVNAMQLGYEVVS